MIYNGNVDIVLDDDSNTLTLKHPRTDTILARFKMGSGIGTFTRLWDAELSEPDQQYGISGIGDADNYWVAIKPGDDVVFNKHPVEGIALFDHSSVLDESEIRLKFKSKSMFKKIKHMIKSGYIKETDTGYVINTFDLTNIDLLSLCKYIPEIITIKPINLLNVTVNECIILNDILNKSLTGNRFNFTSDNVIRQKISNILCKLPDIMVLHELNDKRFHAELNEYWNKKQRISISL